MKYLVCSATTLELEPFLAACSPGLGQTLITGVGPVETAIRLSRCLQEQATLPWAVLNLGTAGAYLSPGVLKVLDLCLASEEILADLGVCQEDGTVVPLSIAGVVIRNRFSLDTTLGDQAEGLLAANGVAVHRAVFATVNATSGSQQRGDYFAAHFGAWCENMEGAAAAAVCAAFQVPLLELRCISNLVEDRNRENWQLRKAAEKAGRNAALVLEGLCRAD
jgi:futalosine hydrolase